MNTLVRPVLKWVGGKRQLLDCIIPLLPQNIDSYCEPFVGGGAVLFSLQPEKAIINDINPELMNVYQVIKDDVDALISELRKYKNTPEHFYKVRNWDRNKSGYSRRSAVKKAARVIYLNKTCYNGLYRVNSKGEFNVPFGGYKNPNIVNEDVLRAVSEYFNTAQVEFRCQEFSTVLSELKKNTFVYLDPPYDPISETAAFTSYSKDGFNRDDQVHLRECCDELDRKGIKFMLSNSATQFIKEQYSHYNISIVKANRAINSVGSKRGGVDEVIVRNYE